MPLMRVEMRRIREQIRTAMIADMTAEGVPFFEAVARAFGLRMEAN